MGSLVAHHLLDMGLPVRVIGRSSERLAPLLRIGAEGVVAEPMDVAALTTAFQGATAAWIMLQPNYIPDSPDFAAYQAQVTSALTQAIAQSQFTLRRHAEQLGSRSANGHGTSRGPTPPRATSQCTARAACAPPTRRLFHGKYAGLYP
jgi:uncharacterized protein YbjT (DUF2867 family)